MHSPPTWKILDLGVVPADAALIEFSCSACGHAALLPAVGRPIAQLAAGVVFDPGKYALPATIECRKCHHQFEAEKPAEEAVGVR